MPPWNVVVQAYSPVGRALLRWLPRFRGYAILGSMACRMLPVRQEASLRVDGREITLDLKRRSQFAVAAQKPEATEAGLLLRCLRPGDVFFDVGSNWGFFTLLGAAQVGEQGLVVSIEANPAVVPALLEAVHRSGLSNVVVVNAAVAEIAGRRVCLRRAFCQADTSSFVDADASSARRPSVVTRTLDLVWRQLGCPRVRMVKLDIEGYEPLALRGGEALLSSEKCDSVQVEVSQWTLERCGVPYEQIYHQLRRWGFQHACWVTPQGELRALEAGAPLPVGANVVFSKPPLPGLEAGASQVGGQERVPGARPGGPRDPGFKMPPQGKPDRAGLVVRCLFLILLGATEARAYVDPGSGALIWQVAVAGLVSSLFWVRKIARWLKRLWRHPHG